MRMPCRTARLVSGRGRDRWCARLAGCGGRGVAGGRFVSLHHDRPCARQAQRRRLGRGQGMEALQEEAKRTMGAVIVRRAAVRFIGRLAVLDRMGSEGGARLAMSPVGRLLMMSPMVHRLMMSLFMMGRWRMGRWRDRHGRHHHRHQVKQGHHDRQKGAQPRRPDADFQPGSLSRRSHGADHTMWRKSRQSLTPAANHCRK